MKKIVLIEDNPEVRETTQEILELANYQVITSENGKKGVELVKSEKPDLIICDIMMPELDGYGVLHILSKNPETSNVPFIFLTAKADKSDIRKGMTLGADDYLTKPFEETELLEAVEVRIQRSENLKKGFDTSIEGLDEFIDAARGKEGLKDLTKDRKTKIYHNKEVIYREDDYANYLYFIIKGKVKCITSDSYGKDFVNDILGTGDFLGYMNLLEDSEYHESAVAIEDTQVAVIPKQDFILLVRKNRDVAASFIKMLSGNVKEKEKRLLQLAYAPVRERVADALLQLHSKSESSDQFIISRQDFASIVGTAKESLNRTMSELKKEGLIDTSGQQIKILDETGLHKVATGF